MLDQYEALLAALPAAKIAWSAIFGLIGVIFICRKLFFPESDKPSSIPDKDKKKLCLGVNGVLTDSQGTHIKSNLVDKILILCRYYNVVLTFNGRDDGLGCNADTFMTMLKDLGFYEAGLKPDNFVFCTSQKERIDAALKTNADVYIEAEPQVTESLAAKVPRIIHLEDEEEFPGVCKDLIVEVLN